MDLSVHWLQQKELAMNRKTITTAWKHFVFSLLSALAFACGGAEGKDDTPPTGVVGSGSSTSSGSGGAGNSNDPGTGGVSDGGDDTPPPTGGSGGNTAGGEWAMDCAAYDL